MDSRPPPMTRNRRFLRNLMVRQRSDQKTQERWHIERPIINGIGTLRYMHYTPTHARPPSPTAQAWLKGAPSGCPRPHHGIGPIHRLTKAHQLLLYFLLCSVRGETASPLSGLFCSLRKVVAQLRVLLYKWSVAETLGIHLDGASETSMRHKRIRPEHAHDPSETIFFVFFRRPSAQRRQPHMQAKR